MAKKQVVIGVPCPPEILKMLAEMQKAEVKSRAAVVKDAIVDKYNRHKKEKAPKA
jgi:hypothetical protein